CTGSEVQNRSAFSIFATLTASSASCAKPARTASAPAVSRARALRRASSKSRKAASSSTGPTLCSAAVACLMTVIRDCSDWRTFSVAVMVHWLHGRTFSVAVMFVSERQLDGSERFGVVVGAVHVRVQTRQHAIKGVADRNQLPAHGSARQRVVLA